MVNLVVEDGTGVTGANTYISTASATTYCSNQYGPQNVFAAVATASPPNDQATALYSAAYAMERLFGRRYLSVMPFVSLQGLLWPRYTFLDNTYRLISMTQIPQCLLDAQCELALLYLNGTSLYPNESNNRLFRMLNVEVGSLSQKTTYWKIPQDVEHYDGFRKVELILYPILESEDNRNAQLTL
jgi:hypothetical protein